ncbi:type II toxin-antitoxin system Phd/YefM family antitoxin [Microbispora rosea]|uniref:type II toxin-antitoxin system Phd/YefM family antitoxin n=1 Tax=Microbispora rosea TaxID=58117 RepID=UPI00118127D3|nr:type II toxin-antitoxin system Phd/YefM family antitoxin [Microbispora rosea]GIH52328.1 hypothetical protein Mro03_75070 [Microbispora rosea subsp. rosea]
MSDEKSQAGREGVRIYKMRDLNQRTAEVIQEINDSGLPAVITRHGRFAAIIYPLLHRNLEGEIIARLLDQQGAEEVLARDPARQTLGISTGELARRLGIEWP